MADYRDWCGHCNAEINFGSHEPDCTWLAEERAAHQALRDFNDQLYEEYRNKTVDEVVDEAIELWERINALGHMQHALDKKWEFLRYELMDKHAIDEFRERTGRRYL